MPPHRTLIATMELAKRAFYTVAIGEATDGYLSAANLRHQQPRRRLRMLDLDNAEVKIDMTAALAAVEDTGISSYGWLLPWYCTASRDAVHELWLGNSSAAVNSTATAAYHFGPEPFWKSIDNYRARFPRMHSWIELPSQMSHPWARYRIDDPDNPDGFIDLGLLIPHPGYVPPHPIAVQPLAGIAQETREWRGASGTTRREFRPIQRRWNLILQATGPNCREEVEEQWLGLQETVGVANPMAVIRNVDATERTMNETLYGTFEGDPEIIPLPQPWEKATMSMNLVEML